MGKHFSGALFYSRFGKESFLSPHHHIHLHHLPALVDSPAFLSAAQGDTTPPATGLFACRFCSFEGLFGILEIVRDHGGKTTE